MLIGSVKFQNFTELARLDKLLNEPSSFLRLELEFDIKLIKKLGSIFDS